MRERSWQVARRIAPVTGAAVTGFIIWTHVTAGTTFFLNVIELLAVLAVIAAVWLVYDHREGFAFAATTVTIASCIISLFTDLYPNVMVSSTNPAYNLTVHNTASGGVLPQGDDRRGHHLPAAWSSPTRPGPTTSSGAASADPNSSRPRHPPQPRPSRSRHHNPLLPR